MMEETNTHAQMAAGSGFRIGIERKTFESPPTLALEGLEFSVEPGEFVAIVGPSGAGKTTLLNIVAGLDRDFEGAVAGDASGDGAGDRRIGYVFQAPRLMPWLTALENVRLVLPQRGRRRRGGAENPRRGSGCKGSRMRIPDGSREACSAGWRSHGRSG